MQASLGLNMEISLLEEDHLQPKKHHMKADSDIYPQRSFPKLL